MRSIIISSGKGGVGKTSISLNLGIALAQLGKKVIVVDADVSMANVGILMGIERTPLTLHNVLMGEVPVDDAIYEGPGGIKFVPSGLSIARASKISFARLDPIIKELEAKADFVIIDSPSGLAIDAESALKAAKEVIIVAIPEPSSVADALKIKQMAEKYSVKTIGFIVNRIIGEGHEIKTKELSSLLEANALAEINEDIQVRRAGSSQQPVTIKYPNSGFSRAMNKIALDLCGGTVAVAQGKPKKGLIESIVDKLKQIFKR